MVLGDALSKLERFVWILNRISGFITWSLNMIFHVVVSVHRLVKI